MEDYHRKEDIALKTNRDAEIQTRDHERAHLLSEQFILVNNQDRMS